MERIRGLIQTNYADSSRPSLKTAVRHWARFCAKHGISVFRPQVADDWGGKVLEEMILMLFLEYLLFEVRVQGSTCESYFSLMKGWHGEEMGYQPASSSLFTAVWISKMLRGARRNFPSVFAEREAHSVTFFRSFGDRTRIGFSSRNSLFRMTSFRLKVWQRCEPSWRRSNGSISSPKSYSNRWLSDS